MPNLSEPFELLDLPDRGVLETTVQRFEEGSATITLRTTGEVKTVEVLRIHVPQAAKPVGVPYWDITSKTLRAQLLPLLKSANTRARRFRITKMGLAPTARFQVEMI